MGLFFIAMPYRDFEPGKVSGRREEASSKPAITLSSISWGLIEWRIILRVL